MPLEAVASAAQREVKALVELLRVPFELTHQAIDDVERGATASDWSPAKEAARKIAFAEDRSVLMAMPRRIQGLPRSRAYPDAVTQAVSRLRLAGGNRVHALVLGAGTYPAASGGRDEGISAPPSHRACGGWRDHLGAGDRSWLRVADPRRHFELYIGQEISIGYLTPARWLSLICRRLSRSGC